MKCPVCKGNGQWQEDNYDPASMRNTNWWTHCRHCDSKGKIKIDTLWKGKVHGYTMFAVYTGMGWVVPSGKKFIIEEDFVPICKMEEVK